MRPEVDHCVDRCEYNKKREANRFVIQLGQAEANTLSCCASCSCITVVEELIETPHHVPMFSFAAFLGFDLQPGLQGIAGSVMALIALFFSSFLLVGGHPACGVVSARLADRYPRWC